MKKLSARPGSHAGKAVRELARVVTACSITVFYARASRLLTKRASAFGGWGRKEECARLCDHPAPNAFAAVRRPRRPPYQRAARELGGRRIPGSDPESNREPAGAAPQSTGRLGLNAAACGCAETELARCRRARGSGPGCRNGAEADVRAALRFYVDRPADGLGRAANGAAQRRSPGHRKGRRGHHRRRGRAWPAAADRDRGDLAGGHRGPTLPPLRGVAVARVVVLAAIIAAL